MLKREWNESEWDWKNIWKRIQAMVAISLVDGVEGNDGLIAAVNEPVVLLASLYHNIRCKVDVLYLGIASIAESKILWKDVCS